MNFLKVIICANFSLTAAVTCDENTSVTFIPWLHLITCIFIQDFDNFLLIWTFYVCKTVKIKELPTRSLGHQEAIL